MKCLKCNCIDDDQEFIIDYYFDEKLDDEFPVYQCPKCGNDEEELIVDDNDG